VHTKTVWFSLPFDWFAKEAADHKFLSLLTLLRGDKAIPAGRQFYANRQKRPGLHKLSPG